MIQKNGHGIYFYYSPVETVASGDRLYKGGINESGTAHHASQKNIRNLRMNLLIYFSNI